MRKILKWMGISLGGLLGLAVLAVLFIYLLTETQINKTYEVSAAPIPIPAHENLDTEAWPLILIDLCGECHGPGLAGQVMEDDPTVGRLVASNLTAGKGGVGGIYSDQDWVRAIRHGVGKDQKSLIVMPSNFFYKFSDADLGTIVSYLKTLPPVDNELPETVLGPMGRVFLLQEPSILPAASIDHDAPRVADPSPGTTAKYGEYLAFICTACHGEDLAGLPNESAGLNLTPAGDLARWSEADFVRAMRTGITPEGENLDPENMPWRELGKLSDDDLKAIWLFLQTLPAVETPTG